MAKHTIHKGQFVSQANVVWRAEIWRESSQAPATVGELRFDASEGVSIEWGEVSKEEPLCPSTATLKVISPADGTYQDLYTIQAGSVGVRIYREDALYWAGTLDAEFYEEPYEMRDSYVVSLTFSDLGLLDRVPLPLRGLITLRDVIATAQRSAGLDALQLDTTMVSLQTAQGQPLPIDVVAVSADNWRDETETYATLKQVLTDLLQPLALRLVSRGGRLYLYDLHGLYTTAQREKIHWMSDSQTLSVDKVVNDCTLTFSPNAESTLLDGSITFTDPASISNISAARIYVHPVAHARNVTLLQDFALFLGAGKGLAYINPSARYFSRLALGGGSQDTGVAWTIAQQRLKDVTTGDSVFGNAAAQADTTAPRLLNDVTHGNGSVVMRSHRVYVPPSSSSDYMLRLTLPILVDVRYNPFHDASPLNETERNVYNRFKILTGWAFIPIALNLLDAQGQVLMHYTNRGLAESAGIPSSLGLGGTWESGVGTVGDAWLAYYDIKDPRESTALSGWASNRPCIGRADNEQRTLLPLADNANSHAYDILDRFGVGQPIPYPPMGGYLEVTVYDGIRCYDYGETGGWEQTLLWRQDQLHSKLRWMLYKAPKLEIARCYGNFGAAELDDVQHRAVVNPDAREHMSLDLACGTHPETAPSARGLLYYYSRPEGRRSQFGAVHTLMRAGDKGSPERLLLNTIFSQFSTRHIKLSGECAISKPPLSLFTEGCQGDRVFISTGTTANLIEDTQESTYVELTPESFRPSNV
ncbi:hypothetical protein [Ihuprevotella massiliensis]|uniref:hypothetical protein n=1 Tax=Ihuprevotella massiliensis TaxID=1852368 RepID=UPI00094E80F6